HKRPEQAAKQPEQARKPHPDQGRPDERRVIRGDRDHKRQPHGSGRKPEATDKVVKVTEDNLPTIGVMRADRIQRPGRSADRKAKQKERRKPKPTKIFELDEDMTQTATTRPRGPAVKGRRPAPGGGRRPDHRAKRPQKRADGGAAAAHSATASMEPVLRVLRIDGEITVVQFADKIGVPPTEVIKRLMLLGEMINLNQTITSELMELLAPDFNIQLNIVMESDENDISKYEEQDMAEKMLRRPPVVTIMGHVDHGKTTLLDRVRQSNVVEGEFGSITQHIGAYHVTTSRGDIVFFDTPGHEAFTAMRARGASVTDLVILVVAANDGFMPQTIEAIHHAQAAKVPIVVAVNKIDLPGVDTARLRQEALQHSLVPEEYGGDTIFVDISAKHSQNLDKLLEMVALQAELLDLKADPGRRAKGIVVESHVDPLRGAVATVLVQKGTLRHGDEFVAGEISGRVRAMNDDRGHPVREAGPSFPAEIIGLTGSPQAGETFIVMPDERSAREVAAKREMRRRLAGLAPVKQHVTLENLSSFIEEGQTKEFHIILKADVQGSIEAISQSLLKLPAQQVRISILHAAVGGINESDVNLADASDAVIIGFNVRPEQAAAENASLAGVEIKLYRIIYDLIEDVRKAMAGMLEPKYEEKVLGHAEVRQLFKISRVGAIAGCFVRDGEITRDCKARLIRDNMVVYEGALANLKRYKEDARRVAAGIECGIQIENYNDLKVGDIIEAYMIEEIEATLE
ncbi:MAG: translation initiation factor IF-2, partial [bacterium]